MTSAARPGWDRVLVELHQVDAFEGVASIPFHIVSMLLRPPRQVHCRLEGGPILSSRLAPGDLIVVPAGQAHWGAWDDRNAFLLAYMSPDTLTRAVSDDGLDADRFDLGYRFQTHDAGIASLLFALRTQLANPGVEDGLYVDTIGVQLAVHLLRSYGTAPLRMREYRGGLSRAKLSLVLDYLNSYLDRNISLPELANLAEMSQFHFLRLFRASSGKTPHRYLVDRRVQVATSILLHEDVSLAEVAYRVGFADQSHLTRHFRRITGVSPGSLRRQRRPSF
jgi:AraC family transcriptional regulator